MVEVIFGFDLSVGENDIHWNMLMHALIKPEIPTAEEFLKIRMDAGWGSMPITSAEIALRNSAVCVCARIENRLVGLARAIGDHVVCFYVSDVFVSPQCRGQLLGQSLVGVLVEELHNLAEPDAMIAVIPLAGLERFYERSGFVAAPNETFGSGLVRVFKDTREGVT
ncbi:hypothetical protein GCM10007385_45030 [Tateyamaria omphalii]|uniref:GNAT family N-acetyltransferase n=1 Tax=Tateyamaria omphalii TaxID=299262 RepID=UPI0016772A66|nr:GNAT family N-acetyltransferase [Tateyamaria omphalii]GGX71022.1 hypothetical protein GCM10007385_45030 [Tateyamaria omphalii]